MDFQVETINIPDNIKRIEDYTFRISGLTRVIIPSTVLQIGERAFSNCTSLEEFYLEHEIPPQFGSYCFSINEGNTPTLYTIYFRNKTVYDALTTKHYDETYGTKSTNYSW